MSRRPTIPLRVQRDVALSQAVCAISGQPFDDTPEGKPELEHRIPVGIDPARVTDPDNLQYVRADAHETKTKQDVKDIAKAKRLYNKHNGIETRRKRPIPNRGFDKRYTKKLDGSVVER